MLDFAGEALVLTHDMIAEGVHFLGQQDPEDIAWRLVATNMSDLAAKGAEPIGVLLGYQLGQTDRDRRFLAGLSEALDHYHAPLLGGDTIGATGAQVLGLTAFGRATHRPVPSRSGACPGDTVWITGALGGAMIGFENLRAGHGDSLAYRRPTARLAEGIALAPQVTAMMDLSDGLLLDASRMADASNVTLSLDSALVPLACPEVRRADALRWGDDYELLFTLPSGKTPTVPSSRVGLALERGEAGLLVDGAPPRSGQSLGFEHG